MFLRMFESLQFLTEALCTNKNEDVLLWRIVYQGATISYQGTMRKGMAIDTTQ